METAIALLLSLFFGFVPMFIFAYIIYWLDRYEKEPKLLLGIVFIWGALVAAGGAFIINTVLGLGVYIFTSSEAATDIATGSLIAPVIEELLKGFAVLIVFILFHKEFDGILDGIVYAAIAALGFAATENAYYIYNYGYLESGFVGIGILTFVRVILVGWQHPFYTAFTGIGFAIARLNRSTLVKLTAPLIGLCIGIFAHSAHNTLATFLPGLSGLAIGTFIDWSGWLVMIIFILWALYREQRWLTAHLREEVQLGVITPRQYNVACSAWSQSYAGFSALFSGRYGLTRRFYQAAGELAFKKYQRQTMGDESGNTAIIEKLRTELAHLSPHVPA